MHGHAYVCPKNFIQPNLLQCHHRLLLESLKFMRKLILIILCGNLVFISCQTAMRIYITVIKYQNIILQFPGWQACLHAGLPIILLAKNAGPRGIIFQVKVVDK